MQKEDKNFTYVVCGLWTATRSLSRFPVQQDGIKQDERAHGSRKIKTERVVTNYCQKQTDSTWGKYNLLPVRIHLDILMSVIVTLSTTFFPGSTSLLHFQLLYVLPTPEWHREDGVSGELQSVYYSFPLPLPPPQCFLLFLHYLLSSGHIS